MATTGACTCPQLSSLVRAHAGPAHRDVNVGLYLPGTGRFASYVPRDVKQRIRVRQRGFVCTYSIDDVSVRLNVSGALETAGLDHALDVAGL